MQGTQQGMQVLDFIVSTGSTIGINRLSRKGALYGVAELLRRFPVCNVRQCIQHRHAAQLGGREGRMPPCACVKRCCMRAGLKQLDQHGCSPGPMPSRQDQEHQRLLDHPLGAGL